MILCSSITLIIKLCLNSREGVLGHLRESGRQVLGRNYSPKNKVLTQGLWDDPYHHKGKSTLIRTRARGYLIFIIIIIIIKLSFRTQGKIDFIIRCTDSRSAMISCHHRFPYFSDFMLDLICSTYPTITSHNIPL